VYNLAKIDILRAPVSCDIVRHFVRCVSYVSYKYTTSLAKQIYHVNIMQICDIRYTALYSAVWCCLKIRSYVYKLANKSTEYAHRYRAVLLLLLLLLLPMY